MDKANGDLISREATLNLWCENCIITKFGKACNRTCRDIERIKAVPAVDAAPVVHGRWELHGNDDDCGSSYFCANCGSSYDEERFYDHGQYVPYLFCPRCGAKMDVDSPTDNKEQEN